MTRYRFTSINKAGYTLAEVMIASALVAIIIPILTLVFTATNKGFTGFEAKNSIKQVNQNTVNRMYLRLGRNKRLFENTSADNPFLARASTSTCPIPITGSKLPVIEENGTLAEGTTNYHSESFGNMLFFAYNDSSIDLTVKETSSSTSSFRIDLYKFGLYYLTQDNASNILGKSTSKVVEWGSIKYANCQQITNITNSTKKSSTIAALSDSGILMCWDPSATSPSVAFSSVTKTGTDTGTLTLQASHKIPMDSYKVLTQITTGLMGGGYQYGVSPNTSGWADVRKEVPAYATESGLFPGGLEIGIAGPSGGRKVLIRSVIMARGSMQSIIVDEQIIIACARDIW